MAAVCMWHSGRVGVGSLFAVTTAEQEETVGRAVTHLLMSINSGVFVRAGQICVVTPVPVLPTPVEPGPCCWHQDSNPPLWAVAAGQQGSGNGCWPWATPSFHLWDGVQSKTKDCCLGTEGYCRFFGTESD